MRCVAKAPAFPVSSLRAGGILRRDGDANHVCTIVRTLSGAVNEHDVGRTVENTGNTLVRFLEMVCRDHFRDVPVNHWLPLTMRELMQALRGLIDEAMARLLRTRPIIVP
jgi:hypothetical protein